MCTLHKEKKKADSDSPPTNLKFYKNKDVYWMQNPQSMDYEYSFTDDTTYVIVPQELQCSREYRHS